MDVVSAFLNAEVGSGVYMKQHHGYHTPPPVLASFASSPRPSIYGILEVSRAFNALFIG